MVTGIDYILPKLLVLTICCHSYSYCLYIAIVTAIVYLFPLLDVLIICCYGYMCVLYIAIVTAINYITERSVR